MRVLVLGAAGMLGHQIMRTYGHSKHDVWGTIRKPKSAYRDCTFLQSDKVLDQIDVLTHGQLTAVLARVRPDWVINCIGLTLRKESAVEARANIQLNALLPHEIDHWCKSNNAKLIHFSTDCVFSGKSGGYTELSPKDAYDVYGQSKSLGEIISSKAAITLRSSIIGREIEGKTELVEWFLSQEGKTVSGFSKALYTGVTTNFMSKLTLELINQNSSLNGLYQVASEPISKLELLTLLRDKFRSKIEIEPELTTTANKTLIGKKFVEVTGIKTPSWNEMISDLASDRSFYDRKI